MANVVMKNMKVKDIVSADMYREIQNIKVPFNYIEENPWIQEEIEKVIDWMQECKGNEIEYVYDEEWENSEEEKFYDDYVKVSNGIYRSQKSGYIQVKYKNKRWDVPSDAVVRVSARDTYCEKRWIGGEFNG